MAFGKRIERTFFKTLILCRFICLTKLLHWKWCTEIQIHTILYMYIWWYSLIQHWIAWILYSNQTSAGNGLIIIIRLGHALVNCRDFHSLLINVRLEYLCLYLFSMRSEYIPYIRVHVLTWNAIELYTTFVSSENTSLPKPKNQEVKTGETRKRKKKLNEDWQVYFVNTNIGFSCKSKSKTKFVETSANYTTIAASASASHSSVVEYNNNHPMCDNFVIARAQTRTCIIRMKSTATNVTSVACK